MQNPSEDTDFPNLCSSSTVQPNSSSNTPSQTSIPPTAQSTAENNQSNQSLTITENTISQDEIATTLLILHSSQPPSKTETQSHLIPTPETKISPSSNEEKDDTSKSYPHQTYDPVTNRPLHFQAVQSEHSPSKSISGHSSETPISNLKLGLQNIQATHQIPAVKSNSSVAVESPGIHQNFPFPPGSTLASRSVIPTPNQMTPVTNRQSFPTQTPITSVLPGAQIHTASFTNLSSIPTNSNTSPLPTKQSQGISNEGTPRIHTPESKTVIQQQISQPQPILYPHGQSHILEKIVMKQTSTAISAAPPTKHILFHQSPITSSVTQNTSVPQSTHNALNQNIPSSAEPSKQPNILPYGHVKTQRDLNSRTGDTLLSMYENQPIKHLMGQITPTKPPPPPPTQKLPLEQSSITTPVCVATTSNATQQPSSQQAVDPSRFTQRQNITADRPGYSHISQQAQTTTLDSARPGQMGFVRYMGAPQPQLQSRQIPVQHASLTPTTQTTQGLTQHPQAPNYGSFLISRSSLEQYHKGQSQPSTHVDPKSKVLVNGRQSLSPSAGQPRQLQGSQPRPADSPSARMHRDASGKEPLEQQRFLSRKDEPERSPIASHHPYAASQSYANTPARLISLQNQTGSQHFVVHGNRVIPVSMIPSQPSHMSVQAPAPVDSIDVVDSEETTEAENESTEPTFSSSATWELKLLELKAQQTILHLRECQENIKQLQSFRTRAMDIADKMIESEDEKDTFGSTREIPWGVYYNSKSNPNRVRRLHECVVDWSKKDTLDTIRSSLFHKEGKVWFHCRKQKNQRARKAKPCPLSSKYEPGARLSLSSLWPNHEVDELVDDIFAEDILNASPALLYLAKAGKKNAKGHKDAAHAQEAISPIPSTVSADGRSKHKHHKSNEDSTSSDSDSTEQDGEKQHQNQATAPQPARRAIARLVLRHPPKDTKPESTLSQPNEAILNAPESPAEHTQTHYAHSAPFLFSPTKPGSIPSPFQSPLGPKPARIPSFSQDTVKFIESAIQSRMSSSNFKDLSELYMDLVNSPISLPGADPGLTGASKMKESPRIRSNSGSGIQLGASLDDASPRLNGASLRSSGLSSPPLPFATLSSPATTPKASSKTIPSIDLLSSPKLTPSSVTSTNKSGGSFRRRFRKDDFDVDNIVMTPSTASNVQIKMPEYKEIYVPNWKELKDEGDEMKESAETNPDETEDISDVAYMNRHVKYEADEIKRNEPYFENRKKAADAQRQKEDLLETLIQSYWVTSAQTEESFETSPVQSMEINSGDTSKAKHAGEPLVDEKECNWREIVSSVTLASKKRGRASDDRGNYHIVKNVITLIQSDQPVDPESVKIDADSDAQSHESPRDSTGNASSSTSSPTSSTSDSDNQESDQANKDTGNNTESSAIYEPFNHFSFPFIMSPTSEANSVLSPSLKISPGFTAPFSLPSPAFHSKALSSPSLASHTHQAQSDTTACISGSGPRVVLKTSLRIKTSATSHQQPTQSPTQPQTSLSQSASIQNTTQGDVPLPNTPTSTQPAQSPSANKPRNIIVLSRTNKS